MYDLSNGTNVYTAQANTVVFNGGKASYNVQEGVSADLLQAGSGAGNLAKGGGQLFFSGGNTGLTDVKEGFDFGRW